MWFFSKHSNASFVRPTLDFIPRLTVKSVTRAKHLTKDHWKTIILMGLALAVIDPSRYIIELFNLPIPNIGGDPPILMVFFWTGMFLVSITNVPRSAKFKQCLLEFSLLGGLLVVWSFLELQSILKDKSPDFTIVRQFTWLFLTWACFETLIRSEREARQFIRIFIYSLVAFDSFVLMIHLLVFFGLSKFFLFLNSGAFGGWNGLCLLSVTSSAFLIFDHDNNFSKPIFSIIIWPLFALPFLEHSRSAIITLALLAFFLAIKLIVKSIKSLNLKNLSKNALIATFIATAVVLGIITFEFIRSREFEFLANPSLDSQSVTAMGSDFHSNYSRFYTTITLLDHFFSTPLLGKSYGAIANIKVAGYPCHTLWAMGVASYGVLGGACLIICIISCISLKSLFAKKWLALAIFTCVIIVSSTTNDVWQWYAVCLVPLMKVNETAGPD